MPRRRDRLGVRRTGLIFKGGFIRPNPYNNKMIHHPNYEPFWAAAEDLDFSIGFHEGGKGELHCSRAASAMTPRFRDERCDRLT